MSYRNYYKESFRNTAYIKVLNILCHDTSLLKDTAISRKVVGKNVHTTIPKGNMGYDQYTVPDTVAVKTSFIAFL